MLMRVRMINPRTNSIVLVHESRLAEYEAMGYTIADSVIADVEAVEICATVKDNAKSTSKRRKKE